MPIGAMRRVQLSRPHYQPAVSTLIMHRGELLILSLADAFPCIEARTKHDWTIPTSDLQPTILTAPSGAPHHIGLVVLWRIDAFSQFATVFQLDRYKVKKGDFKWWTV